MRDFTDYVLFIFAAGERVYYTLHLRNRPNIDLNFKEYPFQGHNYVLALDRAYRIKWAPWKKSIYTERKKMKKVKGEIKTWTVKRFNPLRTLHEAFRPKKIGILFYQQPCTHKCSTCMLIKTDPDYCKKTIEKVWPMHISRIKQPSGEPKG